MSGSSLLTDLVPMTLVACLICLRLFLIKALWGIEALLFEPTDSQTTRCEERNLLQLVVVITVGAHRAMNAEDAFYAMFNVVQYLLWLNWDFNW